MCFHRSSSLSQKPVLRSHGVTHQTDMCRCLHLRANAHAQAPYTLLSVRSQKPNWKKACPKCTGIGPPIPLSFGILYSVFSTVPLWTQYEYFFSVMCMCVKEIPSAFLQKISSKRKSPIYGYLRKDGKQYMHHICPHIS